MENNEQENHNIGESLETSDNNTMLPIIIEKQKKPRKKRESQSSDDKKHLDLNENLKKKMSRKALRCSSLFRAKMLFLEI